MELLDKVAIVTGSTSGIGTATAKIFAREGAKVVVTGRSVERGNAVVKDIQNAGGKAAFFAADMSNEVEVEALFRFTVQTFGKLDILVNNHAPLVEMLDERRDRSIADTASEDWESILRVGLTGFFYTIKNALPLMITNGSGSIINVSSLASTRGTPGLSIYTAAKGGINAMTRQIAADYGKQGIRVNTIVVGTIISNERMATAWSHPKLMEETIKLVCVDRLGKPEDVAFAALYLTSDRSAYVTGSELTIDGGQSSKVALPSLDEGWETLAAAATKNDLFCFTAKQFP
ncbi:MAG: SDR family oxidoreductase [Spongiibacteraceae bacterium]